MPANTLVKNGSKYHGKYVATRSFKDRTVVSSGTNATTVYAEAKSKGVRNPVLVYVPKKGMVHLF